MSEPARTNASPTSAGAIEDEVQEALAICGGDAIAALRITMIANAFLEAFARRKVKTPLTSKKGKENKTP